MAKFSPEAKQKVLAALRSNTYSKGLYSLNENNCFCFWGVVCDVSGLGVWSPPRADAIDASWRYTSGTQSGVTSAPLPVVKWVGGILPRSDAEKNTSEPSLRSKLDNLPELTDRSGDPVSLMGFSDDPESTFGQLADLVEYFC